MHYYSFNIADYRKDTQHLNPMENYIYRELMDWYYLDEKPIPKITKVVLRRLRLGSENNQELQNVLDDFFIETEEGWFHGRIEAEIEQYRRKVKVARANGKSGGRPKKPKITKGVNSGLQEKSKSKANHKPITNNHIKEIKENLLSSFKIFYKEYPKKKARVDAEKAWLKLKPDDVLFNQILEGLKRAKGSMEWKKDNGQFIPLPATFLNGKRWDDQYIKATGENRTFTKAELEAAARIGESYQQVEARLRRGA